MNINNEFAKIDEIEIKKNIISNEYNEITIIEQFSHILAHQLKNNDSDSFNYIYDQIPKEINKNKVSFFFKYFINLITLKNKKHAFTTLTHTYTYIRIHIYFLLVLYECVRIKDS
jgi:hypothetical protein